METYYKVVLRRNKGLYSSFAHMFHYTPVRYRIGKWVKSHDKKNPLLFVTTDLHEARSILFSDIENCQNKKGAIYECEVLQAQKGLKWLTERLVKKVKLIKRIK